MAAYVVDATIVMHYLIADVYTANATVFFESISDHDKLIVPEFCLLECTNVLWKQVRFYNMAEASAEGLLRDLYRMPLNPTPVKRVLRTSLQIGMKHKLAIYDAVYIAMALRTGYPLLTVDQAQSRAAQIEGVGLKAITDFRF